MYRLFFASSQLSTAMKKKKMKQEKIKKNQCGGKRICARKTIPISFFDFQNRAPNLIFLIVPVLRWWEPASVDSGKSACQNVCALQTSHLFQTLKGHTRKILLDGKFLLERKTTSFNFQERLQFCVARVCFSWAPAALLCFTEDVFTSHLRLWVLHCWPVFTFFPCTFFLLNRSDPFNFNHILHCDHL